MNMATTASSINDLAIIPLILGGLFALASGGTYGIGSPWYKSPLGVAFLGLIVSNIFVALVPTMRRLFGEYDNYEIVAWTLYLFFAVVQMAMFVVILRERRSPRLPDTQNLPLSKERKIR